VSDDFDPIEVFPESERTDLRTDTDDCYKCATCDSVCPVAEVDETFPGPKFLGPEQWRLTRKEDREFDDSTVKCSNCFRCDAACPSDVNLSRMHNESKAAYATENGLPLRDRLLANYGRLARVASRFPRLSNALLRNRVTRWLNERLLRIAGERRFPAFATRTFRAWWDDRDGARVEHDEKRVAYFHGDFANYNTPEVGRALVRTFEEFGYEVAVPDQRCSGTPMFANGAIDDARRAARFNVETLRKYVADGYDVICSCTSCSMALRQEYPELFDFEGVGDVAAHTFEALEYLRINEDLEGALAGTDADFPDLAYHAPCHARVQGLGGQTVEALDALEGVDAHDVGDSCSGISGTYGWKAENYEVSMAVGREMFEHIEAASAETGLTECPTCAMQMEHGTGYEVHHPLEVLEAALVEG
jgi:glycerol-3-phosphate dehydrogenase subunit C